MRIIYRAFWLTFIVLLSFETTILAQSATDVRPLELGKPTERELAGGSVHAYSIQLTAGQFLHVVVDQRGIDVVVTLFGPDGKQLLEVDSPNGTEGAEPAFFVTAMTGTYRLEVKSPDKSAALGRYEARIAELRAARETDMELIRLETLRSEANQLTQGTKESLNKALAKYLEELPRVHAQKDTKGEAMALNNIGLIYRALNQPQKALDYFAQALSLFRSVGDRPGEVITLNRIGGLYPRFGEHQKALDHYLQALPLTRAIGDRDYEATILINIGQEYVPFWFGENQKALDYYGQALSIQRALGDRSGEAFLLNDIGLIYDSIGEKQKALDHYLRALSLSRTVGDHVGEAATLDLIGRIYDSVGEKQKALDNFAQALPIMRAMHTPNREASTLNAIGSVYLSLGEKQKALDNFLRALPLFRATGYSPGEAGTLNFIGRVYDSLGEKQKALEYYGQALPITRTVGDRNGEAHTLHNIGRVYDSLGEKQRGLDYYAQALLITRAVGNRPHEAATLYSMSLVELNTGNLNEARAQIEAAVTIIESLRAKITNQELRTSYFATTQDYYKLYIDILMRLHKQHLNEGHDGEALQTSERARARALLETLAEANADIRQGVEPVLLERERTLGQQLNANVDRQIKLLSGRHSKDQAATVKKEVDDLTAMFQDVEAEIRQKSPRYAALTQPTPLGLKEIQQLLDPSTLILEYSLGEEHSYLWVVGQSSIASYELPKRAEVENAVAQFVREVTSRKPTTESDAENNALNDSAASLSRMLIAPAASNVVNKRLVIVADGALQYIPFAALPTPQAGGSIARNQNRRTNGSNGGANSTPITGQPLIVKHEIVNLPSASTLAVLRGEIEGRELAPKMVAVFADPVFSKNDERVAKPSNPAKANPSPTETSSDTKEEKRELEHPIEKAEELGLNIRRLPGTRREAEAILSLAPKKSQMKAFDFDANRATITNAELSEYRYVHFATHGFLNTSNPELSGIVLSMINREGQPENGFLLSTDLFNLRLPSELVVLSACQTGLGKEIKGEGLVGLTRGFMYAGSPRVIVSLWSVSDKATTELMAHLYRQMLRDHLPPAAALRAAQLEMLKQKRWQSPYYWAAFVMQGEWR